MFSYFKSFINFNAESSNFPEGKSKESSNHPPIEISEPDSKANKPSKDTWVFIWNMTANSPGHAAIQIGGSKPKMNAEDPGEYGSIHPKGLPSVGLTSVLPLPAHIANNLAEDMDTLGAEKSEVIADMDSPVKIPSMKQPKPQPPDEVYHFEDLDNSKMGEKLSQVRKKVDSGDTSYQLFPNINPLRFLKDSAFFVAQDPVDVEMFRRQENKVEQSEVHNCTSLVSEVLKSGGIPIRNSKYVPWSITPNGLASELSSSSSNTLK